MLEVSLARKLDCATIEYMHFENCKIYSLAKCILMWWVILLLVKYFLNQQLELALVNGAPMSMALKPQHKESDFAFFC